MKKTLRSYLSQPLLVLITASSLSVLAGCASQSGAMNNGGMMHSRQSMAMEASPVHSAKMSSDQANDGSEQSRKLIKRSWLTIAVKDLATAEVQAKAIVDQKSGYINNTSGSQGETFNLSIRVPQDQYSATLVELRKVGEVVSDNENVQDVTTEFIDNKARLENLYKLRDRIQQLLNRADRIDDLLKIERELNRTQSEIDRLEGRMKYLNSQVNYASIDLTAEKQKTYGPLGYFFMGIWWGVEKLFVWDS
jgi:hypothetical protein